PRAGRSFEGSENRGATPPDRSFEGSGNRGAKSADRLRGSQIRAFPRARASGGRDVARMDGDPRRGVRYHGRVKLESGAWLTPSIQLLRRLDEGAMGSVWAADHVGLGTEVAVKFVADNHAKNAVVRRRLEAEARAAARLKSPHVVRIL